MSDFNLRNIGRPGIVTNYLPLLYKVWGRYMRFAYITDNVVDTTDEAVSQIKKVLFGMNPIDRQNFSNSDMGSGTYEFKISILFSSSETENTYEDLLANIGNDTSVAEDDLGFNNSIRAYQIANLNAISLLNNNFYELGADIGFEYKWIVQSVSDDWEDNPLTEDDGSDNIDLYPYEEEGATAEGYQWAEVNPFQDVTEVYNLFNSQTTDSTNSSGFIQPIDNVSSTTTTSFGGATITAVKYVEEKIMNASQTFLRGIEFRFSTDVGCPSGQYQIDKALKIGSIGLGAFMKFPTSPELGFSKSYDYDGVKTKNTVSGSTLVSATYIRPSYHISYVHHGNYYDYSTADMSGFARRTGRRLYELQFTGLTGNMVFPATEDFHMAVDQTANESHINYNMEGFDDYSSGNSRDFYSTFAHQTLGGQIPFIFIENINDTNTYGCIRKDNFTICMSSDPTFTVDNFAPDYYELSLKLREVW